MKTSTVVLGYVRVSTDEQAASGLGLDAQRERITAYCLARGWTLAAIVCDAGYSASTLKRPAMDNVRQLMRERVVDSVVVLKLDRLTRSVRDLHALLQLSQESGVGLVSVTEALDTNTAAGRLMVTMLGAMAEWEREVISERTVAALAVKRARGERISRYARMGEELGQQGADERAAIVVVRETLERGHASLRALGRELAARGLFNRAGRTYQPSAMKRMVDRVVALHPALAAVVKDHTAEARAKRVAEVTTKVAA